MSENNAFKDLFSTKRCLTLTNLNIHHQNDLLILNLKINKD